MKKINALLIVLLGLLIASCNSNTGKKGTIKTDENGVVILSDAEVENIVRRSYQYVAMYNTNSKMALTQGGWNTLSRDTVPKDHNMKDLARPNNDSFYTIIMLDLNEEPMVLHIPSYPSDYVSLMVTAYDHYVTVPMTTRLGDFDKEEKVLLYSENTKRYSGEPIEGIDRIIKTTGDFVSAILRITPHISEPERFETIKRKIKEANFQTLAEFQGQDAKPYVAPVLPKPGATDADIFDNNLLEVMQFVFNHLSFYDGWEMDNEVLAAYKPLGIEPGKEYDPETAIKIDGKKFREIADKVKEEQLATMLDPEIAKKLGSKYFKPKGETDLTTIVALSVIGPIGLPMEEAMYPVVNTSDGSVMNANNDYVIKMSKDELPPAIAFWSLTLYDQKNGWFIPNDRNKYSVGLNAGFKLNDDGGIDIYVAAEQPDGVPEENWLSINRQDQNLDIILRIYEPDLEKMKTWEAPKAEKI